MFGWLRPRWRREFEAGRAALAAGTLREAETHLKQGLADAEAAGIAGIPLARILNDLGTTRFRSGRVADAEPLYRRAVEHADGASPPRPALLAVLLTNHGHALRLLRRFDEAEPPLRRAVAMMERVHVTDADRATAARNLALVYAGQFRYVEADPLLAAAVRWYGRLKPSDDLMLLMGLLEMADLCILRGRNAEGEALAERCLSGIGAAPQGTRRVVCCKALLVRAELLRARCAFGAAEADCRQAIEVASRVRESHPTSALTGMAWRKLGGVLATAGDYPGAERAYRQGTAALASARGSVEEAKPTAIDHELADLLRRTGRLEEADALLSAQAAAPGPAAVRFPAILVTAELRLAQGRADEAKSLCAGVIDLIAATFGPDHHWTARCLTLLAEARRATGELAESEHLHRRAMEVYAGKLGPDHPNIARNLQGLAEVAAARGDDAAAVSLLTRAHELRAARLGATHPETQASAEALASARSKIGAAATAAR